MKMTNASVAAKYKFNTGKPTEKSVSMVSVYRFDMKGNGEMGK